MNVDLRPRPKSLTRRLTGHVWTPMPLRQARALWKDVRAQYGLGFHNPKFLSHVGDIGKQAKGDTPMPLVGLSLAAHTLSLVANVCQFSTPECRAFCLQEAGNGRYTTSQRSRIVRTVMLMEHPDAAMTLIMHELQALLREHGEVGFRPNVLSDIPWERLGAPFLFLEGLWCYDYTKDWSRESTDRYHLTYSVTERTPLAEIMMKVHDGGQCAVVLDLRKKDPMPDFWRGMPVVDADLHDYRPIDGAGTIAGLRPKGRLNRNSPFVRSAA